MLVRLAIPVLLLCTAPASAQTTASAAAKKFNLDPAVLQPDDQPSAPSSAVEGLADRPADPTPAVPPANGALTLDTPIAALIADVHGKAVLDQDLPGLTTDENLPKFSAKSLRQFQPLTGGQVTDAMLAKVEADLAAPPAPAPPVDRRRRNER